MTFPWERGEPDNDDRADWAVLAADAFAEETYGGRTFTDLIEEQPDVGDDAYMVLQDLISDILHLARRHGWSAVELLQRAQMNFDDEVEEEGLDDPEGL